jgi:EF hand domain-containing protein
MKCFARIVRYVAARDVSQETRGKSAGRAGHHGLECAVLQLLELFQMHVKRRRLPNFESCSVALFTSMALGGAALPARSQATSSPPITSSTSTVPATAATLPAGARGGPPPRQFANATPHRRNVSEPLAHTFKDANLDGDGQLSGQETWPPLSSSFDPFDRNKDGSISSAEFDEALK